MFDSSGFPAAEVQFDKNAQLIGTSEDVVDLVAGNSITDLAIIVHGWNNDIADARRLCEGLAASLRKIDSDNLLPGLSGRTIALAGVFWPSKKFAEQDLVPGGAAAAGSPIGQRDVQEQIDEMRELFPDADDLAALDKAKSLVPQLEDKSSARAEYAATLRSLLDNSAADPEDATTDFFATQPGALMGRLAVPATVVGPSPGSNGAADLPMPPVSGGPAGGAAGLGSTLGGALGAAKNLLNYITYYEMKARAGTVGERGLAPLVGRIRQLRSDLRVHLVGHSFGGRLVSAAANQLPQATLASLTLLQAAFSHYGFSDAWSPGQPGHFRNAVVHQAVAGPILITYTANDIAVGIAYAIASRIAGQNASALGDANDTYGGMGRNGAQKTPEAISGQLLDVAGAYSWTPHALHNLLADSFIKGHSDVQGLQVAYAVLSAIAST